LLLDLRVGELFEDACEAVICVVDEDIDAPEFVDRGGEGGEGGVDVCLF
jgi:hypothetical protein